MNDLLSKCSGVIEKLFQETIDDIFSAPILIKGGKALGMSCVKFIESIKMLFFLQHALNNEITPEEFRQWLDEYGHKQYVIEFIEKQRKSSTSVINAICGAIAKEAFSEKRTLTPIEANHVELLLTLNINDLHNCMLIHKNLKEGKKSISTTDMQSMELANTTRSKLLNYGYAQNVTVDAMDGGIHANGLFFDLVDKYMDTIYKLYITY